MKLTIRGRRHRLVVDWRGALAWLAMCATIALAAGAVR